MTRLFRDSMEAIHGDLREINAILSGSMKELIEALKKLDQGGGKL